MLLRVPMFKLILAFNFEALIGLPSSDFQFCRQTHYYPQSLNTFRQTIVGLFYFGNQIYRKFEKIKNKTLEDVMLWKWLPNSPSMSNISWVIPLFHVMVTTILFGRMAGCKPSEDAEPHQTLLWFLRERMGLTGAKYTWTSRWKLGSMVRINGLYHILLIYKWHILDFFPIY